MLAVLLLAVVASGLVWMRTSGRVLVSPDDRLTRQVVDRLPTDMPTLTPAPTHTPRPAVVAPTDDPAASLGTITHVVASGDTLAAIAARYDVSVADLVDRNGIDDPSALQVGAELQIPLGEPDGAGALDASPPTAEPGAPTESATQETTALAEANAGQESQGAADGPSAPGEPIVVEEPLIHVLASGDTFGGIAAEYDLSLEELLALNADRIASINDTLMIGDEVVVRAAVVVTATPGPEAAPSAPTAVGLAVAPGPVGAEAVPFEPAGSRGYSAPAALSPPDGGRVASEAPWLRWSSVGVLPRGIGYVVAIRDASAPDKVLVSEWVTGNATSYRLPGDLRPARGAERTLEWSVTVQMRGSGVFGTEGTLLGPEPVWRAFTWTPDA
jgi:LysM repeat protein